jgi:hypothetical protein
MTIVNVSQTINAAGSDALTWSVALSGLASGSYSLGSQFDNRPTLGATVSFDLADLLITFSSSFTPSSAGYLSIGILCAVDGSTYPSPPGSSPGAAQIYQTQTFPVLAAATTAIELPNLVMRPFFTRLMLGNFSGVAFPTATITTSLMRRGSASF